MENYHLFRKNFERNRQVQPQPQKQEQEHEEEEGMYVNKLKLSTPTNHWHNWYNKISKISIMVFIIYETMAFTE